MEFQKHEICTNMIEVGFEQRKDWQKIQQNEKDGNFSG